MDEEELTPLDVLLLAMRRRWNEEKVDEAVALAKAAAPYVHAKPASSWGAGSLSGLGGDRLDDLCAAAFACAPAEEEGAGEPSELGSSGGAGVWPVSG